MFTYIILDTELGDVKDQCLMLSDTVVENFPGKLWCCTGDACKTKGFMKGFTLKSNFDNPKKHKKTSVCKLFLPDVLNNGKKNFGKNLDSCGTDPNYVYGIPKEVKQKKATVETCEAEVTTCEAAVTTCQICQTTEHRCSGCNNRCCNFCRAEGENHEILCKTCKAKKSKPLPRYNIALKGVNSVQNVLYTVHTIYKVLNQVQSVQ